MKNKKIFFNKSENLYENKYVNVIDKFFLSIYFPNLIL